MITGEMCQALAIPTASSLSAFVWQIILYLWPWKWILVVLAIGGWTAWEIFTRNGNAHYNSKNGFSPGFNSFVGSGLYWGIQALILLLFAKVFGESIYCMPLPYVIHSSILVLVYLFLHEIGFWPEFRLFKRVYRKYKKRRRSRY